MKKNLVVLFILFILSCEKDISNFERILVNNKWGYYPYEEIKTHTKFSFYIKFYKNNKCRNFHTKSNIEYVEIDNGDDKKDNWYYNEIDKTIMIFGHEFIILLIDDNKILMQKKNNNQKVILYKITDQTYDKVEGVK